MGFPRLSSLYGVEKGKALESSTSVDSAETLAQTEPKRESCTTLVEAQPTEAGREPKTVQDGGARAWLQVLGSFIMFFNLWGYTFAFGSFQNYYESDYLSGTSASAVAWIGSIQSFLLILTGVLAGPLFDLGYFKVMIMAGSFFTTFGALMLSFSTEYWQIFLSQGVSVGLGCGLLYTPTMAFVTRSFVKKRSLAIGAMSCGAPVGAVIFSFLFEGLLPKYGFAWTARAMTLFMIAVYVVSMPLILWRTNNTGDIGAGTARKMFDPTVFRDLPFWVYVFANGFMFMAYLTPYAYMPAYAQSRLGTSQSFATYVLIFAQVASIPGRVGAAVAANYFGVMAPWAICGVLSSVICLVWMAATTVPAFIVFCVLYGFFGGALVPLSSSIVPAVCPKQEVLGARLGMVSSISSIANLIGPPIAGALLKAGQVHGQNWHALQLWCGSVLSFSVVLLGILWVLLVKTQKSKVLM